jgi:hypothetical protein
LSFHDSCTRIWHHKIISGLVVRFPNGPKKTHQEIECGAKNDVEFQRWLLLFHGRSCSQIEECESVVVYVEKNWRGRRWLPMLDEMLHRKQQNLYCHIDCITGVPSDSKSGFILFGGNIRNGGT